VTGLQNGLLKTKIFSYYIERLFAQVGSLFYIDDPMIWVMFD
jgi:hypothetical protein